MSPSLFGDDGAQGDGLPRPHALPVLAENWRCGYESFELLCLGIGRYRNPLSKCVGAESIKYALAAGPSADSFREFRSYVVLPVEDERLLAWEMLEKGGGRYIGMFGDIADTDGVVAVGQKELKRRVGKGLPCCRLLAFASSGNGNISHGVNTNKGV